jgi:hypothetical protein
MLLPLRERQLSIAGVLIELDVPMCSGAEGLVRAGAAATQGDVVLGSTFRQINALEFDTTTTHIGPIRGDANLWVAAALSLFYSIDAIAERTGGTLLDRVDDLLLAGTLGIDEGFLARAEDGLRGAAS